MTLMLAAKFVLLDRFEEKSAFVQASTFIPLELLVKPSTRKLCFGVDSSLPPSGP